MTEVHDLQPDKPAGELLTPDQVALFMKAHNAERPCAVCGAKGRKVAVVAAAVVAAIVWFVSRWP